MDIKMKQFSTDIPSLNENPDSDRPVSSLSGENSVHPSEFLEQMHQHSPSNATNQKFSHQFVCIEYPGLVKDDEKAMKTLGGIDAISTAYSKKNRRVELRFRPDDIYCKPACGNKHQITGLLLKIKVRRKRSSIQVTVPSIEDVGDRSTNCGEIMGITVLGQVRTSYRFKNLCDFQYVATDGKKCIYDSLMPTNIPPSSWLYEETDYFLPPPAFSRLDNMQPYFYQEDKQGTSAPTNIIGCTRQRRAGHAVFVNFEAKTVPSKPRAQTVKAVQLKHLSEEPLKRITELFAERPIWSKNALTANCGFTKDQIKYLLPCVAYYFVTGPWRVMWVRFGYDPRQEREARLYQTLDFRLRTAGGLKAKIKAKRSYSNYLLPYKSAPSRAKVVGADSTAPVIDTSEDDRCRSYIFRPGMLPPSRQMFYQYCDIHVPAIMLMLEKLPTPAPHAQCHERHGWMPPGLDDQCRDIIYDHVLEKLREDSKDDADQFNYSQPVAKLGDDDYDSSDEEDEEEEDYDAWGRITED